MTFGQAISRHIGIPEAGLALVVGLGLLIPFVPLPGEHPTRIAVRFQTSDMPRPGSFTVHTSATICHVLASMLSYEDPATGEFVQINCGSKADALAPQIRAERAGDATTIPAAATSRE